LAFQFIRKLRNLLDQPQEPRYTVPFGKHSYGPQPVMQGAMPWLLYLMRGSRMGKYCSIGSDLKFAFFGRHDYNMVATYPFPAFYDKWKTDTPTTPVYREGSIIVSKIPAAPIIVDNDVWIGNSVTIRQGVTVGSGAVIALNSLVVKDVPPYAIVGGNPAKIIKYRFKPQQIESLLKISWWNWSDTEVTRMLPLMASYDIDKFIEIAEKSHRS